MHYQKQLIKLKKKRWKLKKNGIFSHHEPIQRFLAYLDTWVLYVTGQIRFDSTVFKGKIKYAVTYKLLARLQFLYAQQGQGEAPWVTV